MSEPAAFWRGRLTPADLKDLRQRLTEARAAAGAALKQSGTADEVCEELELEKKTCTVCMDATIETVFIPCGHQTCCRTCAEGLGQCPMCRQEIQQCVRTFVS